MTDKIKLEDMTFGAIQLLKKTIASDVENALYDIVRKYNRKYNLGKIGFSVETELLTYNTESGKRLIGGIEYEIGIKFSKEYEETQD